MSSSDLSVGANGALSVGSSTVAPITFSGLASGLDTKSIVEALIAVDREPITHLTTQQSKVAAQQTTLGSLQSSLQQLSFAAAEFALPSLFETTQSATSSEPLRVSAVTTAGAGVGGYEVEVTQLANSAQRTFSFSTPLHEETLTIDGHEFTIAADSTAKSLASKINASGSATVYAAALENGTIVFSNRSTGNTGAEFIAVSNPGGALNEVAGTAKEGKNAEFSVDGVAGTSSSNKVTTAIAGVTLTLEGITRTGPVTIDVEPPAPSVSQVEAQVQSFTKLYNSTVEAIETQLTTKPPKGVNEAGTGSLFGDQELSSLLTSLRQGMYEPIAGLPAEMASPSDIGLNTGAPNGSSATQSSLEGLLTFSPAKLAEAISANPAGVSKMLEQWSQRMQSVLNTAGGPGGGIEARVTGDAAQITRLGRQINDMNEMLAMREKALQETFTRMESIISENSAQESSLTKQSEALTAQKL
jgi:flagellar hook-associated protein 2